MPDSARVNITALRQEQTWLSSQVAKRTVWLDPESGELGDREAERGQVWSGMRTVGDMQAKLRAEARSACWSEGGAVRASLALSAD